MATAQLVGQDCLAGMDRVRADPGSALLSAAPVAPSTTAGRLAGCFGRERLLGIEVGLAQIYTRWLARVPASVRAPLVTRHPTIDLDSSDIEVYGRTKEGVGWNYAGVRSGRVHLASWAQAELPLAMDLMAGNDDVRPPATELLRRALAVLPTQVCGRPRVRADAGYFDAALAHGARTVRQRGVEVAGISPDPGPSADLCREHREGPAQQLGGRWPDVVVAGHQVHRQRQFGLCPARQVHPAGPDAGVVPADTFLGPAVDLDVGGVQIDGRVPGHQRRPDRRGNPRQPAGVD